MCSLCLDQLFYCYNRRPTFNRYGKHSKVPIHSNTLIVFQLDNLVTARMVFVEISGLNAYLLFANILS